MEATKLTDTLFEAVRTGDLSAVKKLTTAHPALVMAARCAAGRSPPV